MKYFNKKLLVITSLMVATLCGSSAAARWASHQPPQDQHITLRSKAKPESFDAVVRNGEVVDLTGIMKDGRRIAFKQQSNPTCATSCPAGQRLVCWESEAEMMSICICRSGGGGGNFTLSDSLVSS